MSEAKILMRYRRLTDALDGAVFMMSADGSTTHLEARGRDGSIVQIGTFDPKATHDEREFAAAAPDIVRFLLRLVDRAIAKERNRQRAANQAAERDRPKDYAAEIAMKCQEPAFKAFLKQKHGLDDIATDERVAMRVRGMLGVTSRRLVNDDAAAQGRWKELRVEFENWKRAGR